MWLAIQFHVTISKIAEGVSIQWRQSIQNFPASIKIEITFQRHEYRHQSNEHLRIFPIEETTENL